MLIVVVDDDTTGLQCEQIQCARCIQQRGQSLFRLNELNRRYKCRAIPNASRSVPSGRSIISMLSTSSILISALTSTSLLLLLLLLLLFRLSLYVWFNTLDTVVST